MVENPRRRGVAGKKRQQLFEAVVLSREAGVARKRRFVVGPPAGVQDLGGEPPALLGVGRGRERRQENRSERSGRALRVGVERPERRDAVAVELDPDRLRELGREDVDEPAADGNVSALRHQVSANVTLREERPDEPGRARLVARHESARPPREVARRRQDPVEGPRRDDEEVGLPRRESRERAELLATHLE